jgi:hypothetical protein
MRMLRRARETRGYTVLAADGAAGTVAGFLFDEPTWTVRYIVVAADAALARAQVLISPVAVARIDDETRSIVTRVTRNQLARSPAVDPASPVTRSYDVAHARYFGWPPYWEGRERWGASPFPTDISLAPVGNGARARRQEAMPLRSVAAVEGCAVHARDCHAGSVAEVIVNDETWAIRFVAVAVPASEPPSCLLLSPHWFTAIDWQRRKITVDVPQETLRAAPAYDAQSVITRDYEFCLFTYYGREHDWDAVRIEKREPAATGA